MNLKRTATLGLAGGAVAAWLASAATSNRHNAALDTIFVPPSVDARGEALAVQIARLHDRLRPDAPLRQPSRNLFEFTAARQRALQPSATVPKAALTEAPAVLSRPAPPLKLSGIAEDPAEKGPVRTAIITGFGQVFLVKEGDAVTDRYRVSRITADVVELIDTSDSTTLRLALKP